MKPTLQNDLTPAARLAAELAAGVSPEQILHTLQQALAADGIARDGSRQPDHRVRLDAAKVLLSYALGLPIQRSEVHQTVTNRTEDDNMRLLESPAVRSMLKKMLAEAEGGAPD